MANINLKSSQKTSGQQSQAKGSLFKKLLIAFVILMLTGVGFALGIYMKFIDPQAIIARLKLHEYPVIGQYFTPPTTNFEPVELENIEDIQPPKAKKPADQPVKQEQQPVLLPPSGSDSEKIAKAKQLEEAKRISKVARLYENMKPEEVVPIMNKLDDDMVIAIFNKMDESQVAKIMALLDVERAARLSQTMLKAQTPGTL
ncbi:MAG: magnesium transporter MgtE [Veillonellaceae bacterium]|jgi:flagellar protein FlbB|nr:magnesium transporter MgtE [Veillonellaceae bacterium]